MDTADLVKQVQTGIGLQVRALRLARNQSQSELARQAGIALGALKRLEAGSGATLRTLAGVTLALERSEWLQNLYPSAITAAQNSPPTQLPQRLRASKPRKASTPESHVGSTGFT